MGFFSKLFASEPVKLSISNEREAYASILFACMFTDGNSSDEETAFFITMIASRPFFSGYDVIDLYKRCTSHFNKVGGSSALIDAAAAAITDTTRLSLFVNCVDVILSDGVVTDEEEEILDYLKTLFSIDDDFAGKTTEVLLAKNKV